MPVNIVVPEIGESVSEATVSRWLKQEGERVAAGDIIVELETDKVNMEVSATASGLLAQIQRREGEDVSVGDVLAVIDEAGGAAAPQAAPAPAAQPAVAAPSVPAAAAAVNAGSAATPVAQRMAADQNVDLEKIGGTGPGGKVTKDDVRRYVEAQGTEVAAPLAVPNAAPAPNREPLPAALAAPVRSDREERVKMSRRRQTIARRLIEAQQTAAILTTFNEIDMSAIMDFRARHKDSFKEKHGFNLGLTSFFVKATIGALKKFPAINAEIQGTEIVYKHYYDIGIAVGAEEGLVVPVLRDADRMTFAEIEQQVRSYAQQAQENKLSLESLMGGTFTITNGGVFGSLMSTPILNPPQVGILGLHAIQQRPIAMDGQVVIRPMMYTALSYDHRIVDGREAVQFLVAVKEFCEDIEKLMLEG